jgi:hypothetical protein
MIHFDKIWTILKQNAAGNLDFVLRLLNKGHVWLYFCVCSNIMFPHPSKCYSHYIRARSVLLGVLLQVIVICISHTYQIQVALRKFPEIQRVSSNSNYASYPFWSARKLLIFSFLVRINSTCIHYIKKLRGFSPQANYNHRATDCASENNSYHKLKMSD